MSDLVSICRNEAPPAGDIIFVHGLGGDAIKTWGFDQQNSWHTWIKANRPDLNIWSLKYKVDPTEWTGGSMPLTDRALNILALLDSRSLGSRPLCFVAHSMGGLLVKELLRHALTVTEKYKYVATNTKAVVFFSTPHTGSSAADLATYLNFLLRKSVALDELASQQSRLRDLNLWFRNNFAALGIKSCIFYETQQTYGIRVVNESSADPGIPQISPIPLDADHLTITHPPSYTDIAVGQTLKLIDESIPSASYHFNPDLRIDTPSDLKTPPAETAKSNLLTRRHLVGATVGLAVVGTGAALYRTFEPPAPVPSPTPQPRPEVRRSEDVAPARPTDSQLTDAFGWFKERFGDQIATRVNGTPLNIALIASIAVNDSFNIWGQRFAPMPTSQILALCVGDTLDAPLRAAFPKTKEDLLSAPRGAEMFQVAREALEAAAKNIPAYRGPLSNPNKFVRAFGIFGYDLQFYKIDPGFFLNRKWSDFGECLDRVQKELSRAAEKAFGAEKRVLTDFEMAAVAIVYNSGRFNPAQGLKQGFFDGNRYYGELAYDRIKIAKTVFAT